MSRIMHFWILLISLSELSKWAVSQSTPQALVPIRSVNSKIGERANFTCESQGVPLSLCTWEKVPSTGVVITFVPATARPGQSPLSGYSYDGEGLERGQCGLVISNVRDTDNGTWQCSLFTSTGALQRGTVALGILRKPDPPQLNPSPLPEIVEDDSRNPGRSSQPSKITCYTGKGEPQPKFQWFIDDTPLTENLGPINVTTTSNGASFTFQELVNHRFTYRDNGKKLRCVLVHEALTEADRKEVSNVIAISFRPRAADGNSVGRIGVHAELGEEKVISMNVSANPRPSRVEWTVDGKTIREGQTVERYEAGSLRQVQPGLYEVTLKIKGVDEDDLKKKFDLKLTNDYGTADFAITINSASSGSEGLSAGGVLGIILAIIVILVLVAIVVVYSRTRGILCFKGDDGTASEKERMDGGSTGVGAGVVEEKPARRLTSRLTSIYENLLKKKDKTAVVDEEAAKEKDGKEKEGISETTAVTDAESKDKKPEDLVYAELDHTRSGADGNGQRPEVVVRVPDDKTEYAEIIGTAAQIADETSPKKSPKGSPTKK